MIGPDEYHEPVDDSAYTNVMARWNLRRAARAVSEAPGEDVSFAARERWLSLADCIVDGYDPQTGIYEEFAGFHRLEPLVAAERTKNSQLVKQADVVLLHQLVPGEVAPGSLQPNLDFYEPRTSHGSSLSPAMHALLLARVGRLEQAVRYLETAARFDLENRNGTSHHGQHTATQGGVWQALAYGFAGLRPDGDCLQLDPRLPADWQAFSLTVRYRGARVKLRIERDRVLVSASGPTLARRPGGLPVLVDAEPVELEPLSGDLSGRSAALLLEVRPDETGALGVAAGAILGSQGERVNVLEDEQDLRRERIETFARLLVDAYGFEGDEAERERKKIVRTLDKNRDPIHYVRLQRRAKRQVQESDLRRMVAEAGLPDDELEAVLRESIRRVSQSARDRSARTDEPRSR